VLGQWAKEAQYIQHGTMALSFKLLSTCEMPQDQGMPFSCSGFTLGTPVSTAVLKLVGNFLDWLHNLFGDLLKS
jgi:hypothetical protein